MYSDCKASILYTYILQRSANQNLSPVRQRSANQSLSPTYGLREFFYITMSTDCLLLHTRPPPTTEDSRVYKLIHIGNY